MSMVNFSFQEKKRKHYVELSTPQFYWQGVCFMMHMPKRQVIHRRQSTVVHTVLICLSVWEVVFMRRLMCDNYLLSAILIQEY